MPDDLLDLPFDQYQRYGALALAADHLRARLGRPLRILDVGDWNGLAARFCPADDALCLDPTGVPSAAGSGGYLQADGAHLPFADASFDLVASLDTLEHVPRADRPAVVVELLRVARFAAVVAVPIADDGAPAAERALYDYVRDVLGGEQIQLREHAQHGLPTRAEAEAWFLDPHPALTPTSSPATSARPDPTTEPASPGTDSASYPPINHHDPGGALPDSNGAPKPSTTNPHSPSINHEPSRPRRGAATINPPWRLASVPSGLLDDWLPMMLAKHLLLTLPDGDPAHRALDRRYNQRHGAVDPAHPSYRHVFFLGRGPVADLPDQIMAALPRVRTAADPADVRVTLGILLATHARRAGAALDPLDQTSDDPVQLARASTLLAAPQSPGPAASELDHLRQELAAERARSAHLASRVRAYESGRFIRAMALLHRVRSRLGLP